MLSCWFVCKYRTLAFYEEKHLNLFENYSTNSPFLSTKGEAKADVEEDTMRNSYFDKGMAKALVKRAQKEGARLSSKTADKISLPSCSFPESRKKTLFYDAKYVFYDVVYIFCIVEYVFYIAE